MRTRTSGWWRATCRCAISTLPSQSTRLRSLLLNFGALSGADRVLRLHRRFPDTAIVVLANRPTAADCTQMLAFGATGCLSKETEARDIISAIHLASRGMHVLPRSAAVGGGVEPTHGAPS